MTARGTRSDSDWLSLGEASQLLGISPATLRRWADEGRIATFTTPGGHRRFPRRVIRAMLPAPRSARPVLARLGASPDRIARAYRPRRGRPVAEPTPWLARLSDADRAAFRERGQRLIELLLQHLDAEGQLRSLTLQEASRLAAESGRTAAELGASMSEAVHHFLEFRAPFVQELARIARRRGLDTREATDLLTAAEAAIDRLLVAMMTGHSLATAGGLAARQGEQPARRAGESHEPVTQP